MESLKISSAAIRDSLEARAGLKSKWPVTFDLSGSEATGRFEGEAGDLIVYGEIPSQIDGTFYRVSPDRFMPKADAVPIDGDGSVSAFRIKDGRVDFKVKYIQTERYKSDRRAGKSLFGGFKNSWDHHPCVRAAVDSTANTNVVYWAGRLLTLDEGANPYEIDPDTLETLGYDPYYDQIKSKAFTAHPKVDPFTQELVTFGYEATGPGSVDVVTWSIGKDGKKTEEVWVKSPFATLIHDCGITENYLVLMAWPFEAMMERMKTGGHHWAYRYDRPAVFIVVPRRKNSPPPGWQPGEYRVYNWKNCVITHTAGSWEEKDGKIFIETTRIHDNVFPFFPDPNGRLPPPDAKADFVRWEIDPSQPTDSWLPDPKVLVDFPSEFPRIDERLMGKKYKIMFLAVHLDHDEDGSDNVFHGLNTLAMLNTDTGEMKYFYPGAQATVQEPTFIPRSQDAPEGDGWVMALVEQRVASHCELVVIDTKDFTKPIAIAKLPFRVKSQIHGNWIDGKDLSTRKSIVHIPEEFKLSNKGHLMPL
ncbi:carotenoid oxygenase [Cadophora sp. MPI-SDFR-AT-0126]|nr:carotenoid oxygenase [Leotiomycetes sp. MPI-SDFR-AT-0126]